jgi:predicted metal-dependent phosphoesterase TrpH
VTAPMDRLGRADLHVHTWASDGTDSVVDVLEHVEAEGFLDLVGITDHERIDAALAGRAIAHDRGMRLTVVVGEEITTRGGHLLGLFLENRVPPWKSLEWSIEAVHDQGGIAIPAHPFVPLHLCAQSWVLRKLLLSDNPAVRPDAIETFNPTALGKWGHARAGRFARDHGLAPVGNSDAHIKSAVASAWTTFPGRTIPDFRAALEARTTQHHGSFHGSIGQLGVYTRQLRKYARDVRAETGGRIRRDGTGRDHGYPGGTHRPPRYQAE